jgi:hypothetical protein
MGIATAQPRRRHTPKNKPEASRNNAVAVGMIPAGKLAFEIGSGGSRGRGGYFHHRRGARALGHVN